MRNYFMQTILAHCRAGVPPTVNAISSEREKSLPTLSKGGWHFRYENVGGDLICRHRRQITFSLFISLVAGLESPTAFGGAPFRQGGLNLCHFVTSLSHRERVFPKGWGAF